MQAVDAAVAAPPMREARTLHETATRMGAHYHRSWPVAIVLVPLILVVMTLEVASMQTVSSMIGPEGQPIPERVTQANADRLLVIAIAAGVIELISLVAWSLWIALVTWSVPALTAKWPSRGPVGAFFAAWIPFVCAKRPYTVVRGVLAPLSGGRAAPQVIALAWWLFVVASYAIPLLVEIGGSDRFATELDFIEYYGWVYLAFHLPAGALAMTLVVVIELAQQRALDARDVVLVQPGSAPAPI
jgi:hypothetical protein